MWVLPIQSARLNRALYGLKQAARQWNKKLHDVFTAMGYHRLESDRSIYVYAKGSLHIIVPIFIDDITIASIHQKDIDSCITQSLCTSGMSLQSNIVVTQSLCTSVVNSTGYGPCLLLNKLVLHPTNRIFRSI